jgi:hypothetical protein
MFHKFGDTALEKLVPKSETEAMFKAALTNADAEIAELKKDKQRDRKLRQAELSAMGKIEDEIKQQVCIHVCFCMRIHVRIYNI